MHLMLLLLTADPAHAITQTQAGPYVELGIGGGGGGTPVVGRVGGHGSVGLWRGTYDDAYSFGRYWSLGLTTRVDVDLTSTTPSLAPMLEIRRGLDVFVANVAPFVAGGPLVVLPETGAALGGTARGGIALKWRRHRFWGMTVRAEGGIDALAGQIEPTFSVCIGAGFARPARQMQKLR